MNKQLVSFVIVAYNAENSLNESLGCLNKQNYPHENIEVILVNSNSTDNTKKVMEKFKKENKEYKRVIILENPKKILPCGWNVALKNLQGELIIRVDAHSTFPEDFILKNVEEINKGENIVGGRVLSLSTDESPWIKSLALVDESLFGSGIAKFRSSNKREYVSTLAYAMYKKEVFDNVGFYNEKLARTEDNEMHYRMRQHGYKFLLSPEIVSYHHARKNLKGMIKQKYENGKWIGITVKYCPKCFSIYHYVPFLFVLAILVSMIFAFLGFPYFLIILGILYGLFSIINLLSIIFSNGFNIYYLLIPFIIFILHICYGFGTVVGLIRIMLGKN